MAHSAAIYQYMQNNYQQNMIRNQPPMNVTLTHPSEYLAPDAGDVPDACGECEDPADHLSSAPPLELMDKVNGYEDVSFYVAPLQPPANDHAYRGQPPSRSSFTSYPALTEDQAREALLNFVSEHCCYGKSAAEEMVFRSIENTSAFHYTLETFGESRQTCWMFEPYIGQPIDSCLNGPAPTPWEIGVPTPAAYKETKMKTEVPHTASVKSCHDCAAIGRRRCPTCLGDGQVNCTSCGGSGTQFNNETCSFCNGQRKRRYSIGLLERFIRTNNSDIRCLTCHGLGQIFRSPRKNHIDDYIVERTSLPDDLVRTVSGQLAFEEDLPRVWPINHFPDQAVNIASTQLVQQHNTNYSMERIIRQTRHMTYIFDDVNERRCSMYRVTERHRVRIVPVTQVYYTWKEKTDYFFVYGFENKVYAPNYPQKCCCGCCIL
uniref:CR-type domain-containing protein n=1 Tax=Strigamia maritima TaxID=126957 RepID=T1JCR8_STRMM